MREKDLHSYVLDTFLQYQLQQDRSTKKLVENVSNQHIDGLEAIVVSRSEELETSRVKIYCMLVLDAMDKPSVYGMYAEVTRGEDIPQPVNFGKTLKSINAECVCNHIEGDIMTRNYGIGGCVGDSTFSMYHSAPGWFEFTVDSKEPGKHKIRKLEIDKPLELAKTEVNLFEDICQAYVVATTAD